MKRYLFFLSGFLCSGLCLFAQTDSTLSDTANPFNTTLDTVVFSTGFQTLPRERATGSFTQIGNELFNRRVGPDVLSRLDGIASGVVFNKNTGQLQNQSAITIRGRSTLFANPNPLIVIDNFPYDGDINNINPNDVESVTILKDAAAASIWGARSSNGVIVITTKKARLGQPLTVILNNNVTVSAVPDLYYYPQLDSKNYIELERFFFDNGQYFSGSLASYSPVVDLLFKAQEGSIGSAELEDQLARLGEQDSRQQLETYAYRRSFQQQHSISLSGSGRSNQYYFSAGFDRGLAALRRNDDRRLTLNFQNTFSLLKSKASLSTGIAYTNSAARNNYNISKLRVYDLLADEKGRHLPINFNYRDTYTDTVGQGQLKNWKYVPLDELALADNESHVEDVRINVGLDYLVIRGLKVQFLYQYSRGLNRTDTYYPEASYYSRDLYNQFAALDYSAATPSITPVIPAGGIFDQNRRDYFSHQGRAQLSYNSAVNSRNFLSVLAGVEIKANENQTASGRLYGYDKELQTATLLNFATQYPIRPFGSSLIFANIVNQLSDQRFFNAYFNGSYSLSEKYIFSASVRRDASNLFGVNTNQRAVPLGSIGFSWNVHNERFLKAKSVSLLRLRTTVGYNGNLDNNASALPTITYAFINNFFGSRYAITGNPPNPELQWERVLMGNIGIDFSVIGGVVSGSADMYKKAGKDLLGYTAAAPQVGFNRLYRNGASVDTKGMDITLHTRNIDRQFTWQTDLLFSYTRDKVKKYTVKPTSVFDYIGSFLNPLEERPLYSMYSLPWGGLDETGQPQAIIEGKKTVDYSSLFNSDGADHLVYNGPINPVFFGNLRNTFSFKSLSLSANIAYRGGFFVRGVSMDYSNFLLGAYAHPDYKNRWRKPGDEQITTVPALQYPVDYARETFYSYSSVLIERGDHVRLQDIQLNYTIDSKTLKRASLSQCTVYLFANNLGILWRANKAGIDPDAVPVASTFSVPALKTLSLGVKFGF